MKLRKFMLLLVALVFALSVPAYAATVVVELPVEPTLVNNSTQKGWCTDGTDDIATDLTMEQLAAAESLVLEFAEAPSGGMQFIWQGDGDGWGWNQTDQVIPDGGISDTTFTIDLAKTAKNYDALKSSTKAKIILGYYSDGFDDLKITKAYLTYEDAGAVAEAAPVAEAVVVAEAEAVDVADSVVSEENPKTGDNFIIYFAGLALVLAACGTVVFYRKAKAE